MAGGAGRRSRRDGAGGSVPVCENQGGDLGNGESGGISLWVGYSIPQVSPRIPRYPIRYLAF